jgi:hypothetical protein
MFISLLVTVIVWAVTAAVLYIFQPFKFPWAVIRPVITTPDVPQGRMLALVINKTNLPFKAADYAICPAPNNVFEYSNDCYSGPPLSLQGAARQTRAIPLYPGSWWIEINTNESKKIDEHLKIFSLNDGKTVSTVEVYRGGKLLCSDLRPSWMWQIPKCD